MLVPRQGEGGTNHGVEQGLQTLFDDDIAVAYHSFGIAADADDSDEGSEDLAGLPGYGGQVNGLCGAAIPGVLQFITGLHTGDVRVRIELHDTEPAIDLNWPEIVEASFSPSAPGIFIDVWGDASIPLPNIEVRDYRVRFAAIGFDNDDNEVTDPPERYLIHLWPAPRAPDRIVRQTSRRAAYWHQVAQRTPAPPSAEERAAVRAEKERRRRQEAERFRREDEARYWGGRAPDSDRLREIAPRAVGLARIDRNLVDEIAAVEPQEQRAMAAWAARETCRRAGLADEDWVVQALEALDLGDPAPACVATFDDAFARWQKISTEQITHSATVTLGNRAEKPRIAPEVSAIHAIIFARETNPLEAALDTVRTAAEVIPGERATVIAAFRARFELPRPAPE